MVSKHHACTSFGLKKNVEPALTALSMATSKQASIHTHLRNVVTLVWGLPQ